LQEFVKNVTEKKGVAALAAWEKRKIQPVVSRRIAILAGLSMAEILVAIASAVLVGSAFYLMYPDPSHLISALTMFILVAGISVVVHDLARRWMSRRQGRDTEYQIWPLGMIVMFLTAWLFACPCGKPSRPVSQVAPAADPRQKAFECLAGPGASVLLACLFALLILAGEIGKTIGIAGISINIALAFYSLMPFDPMEGQKVWSWNRTAFLGIIIPLVAAYLITAYLFS
jgi:Zn-dependent protease